MTRTSGQALKMRRKMSGLTADATAEALGFNDTRSYYRYESDETRDKDPALMINAMNYFGDYTIGLYYLSENPIFTTIFGQIPQYENQDDREIVHDLKKWALTGGQTPLPCEHKEEILDTAKASIALYVAATNKEMTALREQERPYGEHQYH